MVEAGGSLWLYLGAGMFASILLAVGLLMMKSRAEVLPPARGVKAFGAIWRWLSDPVWIGGLGVETAGYALYVVALADAPVSLVAVTMQGGIALFVLFAALLLHERACPREWVGIGGIVFAMVMLALSLNAGATEGGIAWHVLAALSAAAIVAALAPYASVRMRVSGIAAAIASGIAFGLASIYTKALTDMFVAAPDATLTEHLLGNPYLYLTITANIIGLILLQNSFHWARGIIAMPLSSACSNIVPIIGGIVAFGESLPSNPFDAALRVSAFVLTIAAGALLAVAREPVADGFHLIAGEQPAQDDIA
ncbi:MAG: hypothetical protein ACREQN_16490 [Candidatus Binataceae bacterium]